MSQWDDLQMDSKITQIFDVHSHDPNHPFRRPFMTSYQIALEFEQRFPNEFRIIGKPVGGLGIRQRNSLAQYIAQRLSARIGKEITNIEGRFLHRKYLHTLQYEDGNVQASSGQSYDLSMFRLLD
jgi:hypothetical protein